MNRTNTLAKAAESSGGDRSVSCVRREPCFRASGGTAAFDGDDSGDGDAGKKTPHGESARRAGPSMDGRRDLA
jgi:hypothetical protein